LELHPTKNRVVYVGDEARHNAYPIKSFDFLEFNYRKRFGYSPKLQRGFVSVLPAISNQAKKALRQTIRSWRLHRKIGLSLAELAKRTNPIVIGWVNYYGKFYRSELTKLLYQIEQYLKRWAQHTFAKKTGCASQKQARKYLGKASEHNPSLFVHWRYGMGSLI
jgi:RNA-directed DNA polymerase